MEKKGLGRRVVVVLSRDIEVDEDLFFHERDRGNKSRMLKKVRGIDPRTSRTLSARSTI